jgi:hypothetical protein
LWDHNRFVESRPGLRTVTDSAYVRGAVTGVGVITALAGLAELGTVIAFRARGRTPQ